MESHPIDVKIVGNQVVENHTEYVMVVSFSNKTWQVQKRYRQFDSLCSSLRRAAPQLPLPPLPPKNSLEICLPVLALRQEHLATVVKYHFEFTTFFFHETFRGF